MPGMRSSRGGARILCVVAVLAALLVPAWLHPVKAVTFPATMARTLTVAGAGRASFSFPATHVAFSWTGDEKTGVRYRVVEDGVPSRWRRAAEAHDMEHGDHHYSGIFYVDRASAVEWEPMTPEGTEMGPIRLDYLNTLDGPRRSSVVPLAAGALAEAPDVVTRAEWGADESIRKKTGSCKPTFFRPQQLFVHHTVGSNYDPRPKATMRAIYRYHTVTRGWCDIGYNFVIGQDGRVYEGRFARRFDPWEIHDGESRDDRIVRGAHTLSHNEGSIGVSLMGNFSTMRLPKIMRRTLVGFLAWEADRHNLNPTGSHTYRNPVSGMTRWLPHIPGQRVAGQTECHGNYVYGALPNIREAVAGTIGVGKRRSEFTRFESLTPISLAGTVVRFVGKLETPGGADIAGRTVRIRFKPYNARWREVGTTTTDAEGDFTFARAFYRTGKVVAHFTGDNRFWDSQSEKITQRVRDV